MKYNKIVEFSCKIANQTFDETIAVEWDIKNQTKSHKKSMRGGNNCTATCDFQQCGILTSLVISLTVIEYSSN